MSKKKNVDKPMTPVEVNQALSAKKYDRTHNVFLASQAEDDNIEWELDPATKKWFIDDGKLYNGEEQDRKFVVAEIQPGSTPGLNQFPQLPFVLFVKGQRITSDTRIERLKETAIKLMN